MKRIFRLSIYPNLAVCGFLGAFNYVTLCVQLWKSEPSLSAIDVAATVAVSIPLAMMSSIQSIFCGLASLAWLMQRAFLFNSGFGETLNDKSATCLRQVFIADRSFPLVDAAADISCGSRLLTGVSMDAVFCGVAILVWLTANAESLDSHRWCGHMFPMLARSLWVSFPLFYPGKNEVGIFEVFKRGESLMRQDNEYRDRPIERSVVVLGAIAGAVLYVSVALLTIDFFDNAGVVSLSEFVASFTG